MALDLEKLLAPVSEDNPSGADLSYDPRRYEIEQAFEIDVSIDASGEESQASDIDWRSLIANIAAQSAETKDVWLAVYLARAGALSGDLETTETGVKFLAGLLEDFWPTVHPDLEEYGFQGRKGPCESLAGNAQFINPLKRMRVLRHPRLGEYSGVDFERFRAGAENEEGYGMFRAALEDVGQEGLDEIAQKMDAITEALKRVDLALTSNADSSGAGVNFQPTFEALAQIKRGVLAFGSKPVEEAGEGEAPAQDDTPAESQGGGGPRIAGRVDSRQDVQRAIDAISDYYRRKEPSHPILALMGRAREWIDMDFMSIVRDISPAGTEEARTVLMSKAARDQETAKQNGY